MADPDHDVVVVGSGAGGGACAWRLVMRGLRVLLLEAGPAYDPVADYRLDREDWEQTRFPDKIAPAGRHSFAPMQQLDPHRASLRSWSKLRGRLVPSDQRANWGYHHVIGVGGSTLHFTGEAHRLNPRSMRLRSQFGVGADWPVDYAALEPYYEIVERVVGVAGPANDPSRPRRTPFPLPAHPMSYASQRIAQGCQSLGLAYVANSVAALSRPYDDRPPCNYCGNCARGCPRLDKGTVDLTFLRRAATNQHYRLMSGCRVLAIEAGRNDRVAAVIYADASGARQRVETRAVAVACGAVETPRLLLASTGRHAPEGLATESGQVGRNFMETIAWTSVGLHPLRLGSHRGLPVDGICWDYNAPDAIPGVVGGCRFNHATAEADMLGPIAYAQRIVGGWGHAHKRRMRETFGRALGVGAVGESLPNPRSYVDLDPTAKDAAGVPLARIHSHLDETEIRRLHFMADMSRRILDAAGASDIVEEHGTYDAFNATHVGGTCRMGADPRESVVDPVGRSHRWRNLFIVDGSVLPSMGGGEGPSLTIEALAVRSADAIAEAAGRGEL